MILKKRVNCILCCFIVVGRSPGERVTLRLNPGHPNVFFNGFLVSIVAYHILTDILWLLLNSKSFVGNSALVTGQTSLLVPKYINFIYSKGKKLTHVNFSDRVFGRVSWNKLLRDRGHVFLVWLNLGFSARADPVKLPATLPWK